MKKSFFKIIGILLTPILAFSVIACEDEPDKYESTGGTPTVDYIRLPESADSIITERSMESTICLVGSNLKSIREIYFNDQKAVLNTSFITDNTLLVDIPKNIPGAVTDKIYMINSDKDTTTYNFHVVVPAPTVASISSEYAQPGEEVTINGDYFIDDPNTPLTVSFNNGTLPATNITSISKGKITVTVPNGANTGYVYVKSVYGNSKSKFVFRDDRNILFDFDGSHGGLTGGHGWRNGVVQTNGIDGAYLHFGGTPMAGKVGSTWDEDHYALNYWPEPSAGFPELSEIPSVKAMLDSCDINDLQIKFEVQVPTQSAWASSALQIIFTGNNTVTYNTGTNGYYNNTAIPRGLWLPWQTAGSFTTDSKWITVSLPLSTFTKTHEGQASTGMLTKESLTGLTLFVWNGGIAGTDCTPEINIDNIRLVPIE